MGRVWAYCLIGVGAFMGLGVGLNAGAGHGLLPVALALGLFSVLPIGLGVRLLRSGDRPARVADADRAWESELMRLAERRAGALTVAEAVAHADLAPERAQRILDDLCRRGLAEHRVTDDGQIVYAFEGAPSAAQKRRAEGVLDD